MMLSWQVIASIQAEQAGYNGEQLTRQWNLGNKTAIQRGALQRPHCQ